MYFNYIKSIKYQKKNEYLKIKETLKNNFYYYNNKYHIKVSGYEKNILTNKTYKK